MIFAELESYPRCKGTKTTDSGSVFIYRGADSFAEQRKDQTNIRPAGRQGVQNGDGVHEEHAGRRRYCAKCISDSD